MGRYAGRFHQSDRPVGDRVEARIALTTNPSPMVAVIEYGARRRGYAELAARERLDLNLSWIREEGATDPASLPLRWTPETGQVAKRESCLGAAVRPRVRHDQYAKETRP